MRDARPALDAPVAAPVAADPPREDSAKTAEANARPAGHSKASLGVIFLTVFIDLLGFGMVLPLLPIYGERFAEQLRTADGRDHTGLVIGLLMSSFSIMQFLFAPFWGRLSDRVGRRPVLLIGLAGSVAFYGLFGLATMYESLAGLFVARIGAGIAGATIAVAQAYIADATAAEHRTRGMALIGAAFGLGFTFGPVLAYFALPDGSSRPGPGPGFIAAGISLVAFLVALTRLPESLPPEKRGRADERRPRFGWREALAVPSLPLLIAATFLTIQAFAMFESSIALALDAKTGFFDLDFRAVCATFAGIGLTSVIGQGVLVRRLSKVVSEAPLATSGAVLEIAGLALIAAASSSGSRTILWVGLVAVVLGFSLTNPSLTSLISRRTRADRQGAVLGVAQGFGALARILGPLTGVPLFFLTRSRDAWTTYGAAAAIMFLGLVLIVLGARGGRDAEPAAE